MIRKLSLFLAAAVFAASLLTAGCAARVRVYDPYDHAYRAWAPEASYYGQWEHDTHREHMEYQKRNAADQKAYWEWRHNHDQH